MVSVMGKELVPYDARVNRHSTSTSSSSSIVIDSSPEDCNEISNDCTTSDSESSSVETVAQKPLALLERIPMIQDLDSACVKEILKDHERYPPQHEEGDREDVPATKEKLDYFYKVLNLKSTKYSKLDGCKIPPSLRTVPLALSYRTFITMYWPGAIVCCDTLYRTTRAYGNHFYKLHKSASPLLTRACMAPDVSNNSGDKHGASSQMSDDESDSNSDVVMIPDEPSNTRLNTSLPLQKGNSSKRSVGRPSVSNDNSNARKRKSLSPSSRPAPLRHKQAKLNHTISMVDSSLDSGDEKHSSRPKRNIKKPPTQDGTEKKNEEWEDQLHADQIKYQPQHEPGAPENFVANAVRLNYFNEVLALKFGKYGQLNSTRPNSPSRHVPLAQSLHGFMQYYWPGKLMCCGLIRENLNSLERHIARSHRPPKLPPTMTLLTPSPLTPPVSDNSEAASLSHATVTTKAKSSKSDSSKYPPGFEADQNNFVPQHKPGEPEDFLANQPSIDYFIQALELKWEKYSHLAPLKGQPLSSAYSDFVLNYWPGIMSCCDKVYTTCKEFQLHLTTAHLPSKKIPQLSVVIQSDVPPKVPEASVSTPEPTTQKHDLNQSSRPSPCTRRTSRLTIESGPSNSEQTSALSILTAPAHMLRINAIHSEASQLRKETAQAMSISEVLPLLDRLLDLSSSIVTGIRGAMEVEARSRAVECLEYVWNASKIAIVRWEDIKGRASRDPYLAAIQYAYGTLPVFTNWEQNKHLEMLENVILLSASAVKNWEPSPSSPEAKKAGRSTVRRRTVKQMRTEATATQDPAAGTSSTALDASKETRAKNLEEIKEFCRVANISVWQNTKGRSLTGYKDDEGNYHVMYRYGIAQMLKLYCPPGVTHLKCCDEEFDLTNLRVHVTKFHEGFQPDRTEPSISPV